MSLTYETHITCSILTTAILSKLLKKYRLNYDKNIVKSLSFENKENNIVINLQSFSGGLF